jgi:hypothetical protein
MIADAKQVASNKPYFMYFALGAMHSPHHVPKEWADKYKGKFDAGWDAYRKQVFEKQKELGIIPKNTELSRYDPDVQDWEKLSAGRRFSITSRGAGGGRAMRLSVAGSARPTVAVRAIRSSSAGLKVSRRGVGFARSTPPYHRHGTDGPRCARHRAACINDQSLSPHDLDSRGQSGQRDEAA